MGLHELTRKQVEVLERCGVYNTNITIEETDRLNREWLEEKASALSERYGLNNPSRGVKDILGLTDKSLEEKLSNAYARGESFKNLAKYAKQHFKENKNELDD